MMSSGDDVPSTIVCHFFDELGHAENDEDVMMDVLDFSTSIRSSLSDSHLIDAISGATTTEAQRDHVTDQELRAMKDMVASMRRNPELLKESPVMQRACLTSSSLRRDITDKASTDEANDVKNEDLCAMKDMIASMRKNPQLLYQSPVMQKACFTTANTATALTHDTLSLISPHEATPPSNASTRRPLGTKFDPSTFPSLPLPSVGRGLLIDKNGLKAPPSPAAVAAPPSKMKIDTKVQLSKTRPRSI